MSKLRIVDGSRGCRALCALLACWLLLALGACSPADVALSDGARSDSDGSPFDPFEPAGFYERDDASGRRGPDIDDPQLRAAWIHARLVEAGGGGSRGPRARCQGRRASRRRL